jgi:hypothetical protein
VSSDASAVARIGNLKEAPGEEASSTGLSSESALDPESFSAFSICLAVSQGMNFTGPITMLSAQSHAVPLGEAHVMEHRAGH